MTAFTVEELELPPTMDDPRATDLAESVAVGAVVEELAYGTPELAYAPAEELAHYLDPENPTRVLVARVGGRIVARALYERQGDSDAAWVLAEVHPDHRGLGIGRALADALERLALDDGKRRLLFAFAAPEVDGERLSSPTGFGSIATGSREVRFLLARGFRFEQVERVSRMPLPLTDLDERIAAARSATGAEYRTHAFEGRVPHAWLDDMAVLRTRMSTDAPSAGLEWPEDVWTAERILEAEDRYERISPRRRFTAVAEHAPTGRLVGFTVLSAPPQPHRAVDQYATLVLKEHRGHGLGMLLKLVNLQLLQERSPGHPAIITFNAEENRHMLRTNEALGFEAIAYEAAWRKDLDGERP